jgi:uncharacterized protein (TIGR02118 family)
LIKVSVLYPHQDGSRFDMAYYCEKHMPMVRQKLGAACKGLSVDQGMSGGAPGSAPVYDAIGHLLFDSLESFQSSFAPHSAEFMADVPNYTSIRPIVQISEVKL